jgi:hypothetical protein
VGASIQKPLPSYAQLRQGPEAVRPPAPRVSRPVPSTAGQAREDVLEQALAHRRACFGELADELGGRRHELGTARRLHRPRRTFSLALEALTRRRLLDRRRPAWGRRALARSRASRANGARRARRAACRLGLGRGGRVFGRFRAGACRGRRAFRLPLRRASGRLRFGRRALAACRFPRASRARRTRSFGSGFGRARRASIRAGRLACRCSTRARALWARARQVGEHAAVARRARRALAAVPIHHRHIIA